MRAFPSGSEARSNLREGWRSLRERSCQVKIVLLWVVALAIAAPLAEPADTAVLTVASALTILILNTTTARRAVRERQEGSPPTEDR